MGEACGISYWRNLALRRDAALAALAQRLKDIACVAEGAPYVARGLLLAQRFADLGEDGAAVIAQLKSAARAGGVGCPGTEGLVERDFGEPG